MAYRPTEHVREVQVKLEEAKQSHDAFVRQYNQGERAYNGLLSIASDAAKWRHKVVVKLVFNMIETIVSNTVEMGLRFETRPAPHTNLSLPEAMEALEQADLIGDLLRHEHRVDGMDFKQRPLFLTSAIGGRGILETGWNYTKRATKRQGVKMVEVGDPEQGLSLQVPLVSEVDDFDVRDHSTCNVIDPRDFIIPGTAEHLDPFRPGGAQHLFHRCWYSYEQLLMLKESGFLKNVEALKDVELDWSAEDDQREKKLWEQNSKKDLIEVIKYWCFKDGQVNSSWIGNRYVELRSLEAAPFWHGGYPYILNSSMPQPFSTRGVSDVELVEALQEVYCELLNQKLDNIELINNAVLLIRSDVEDPDAFEHYPGARWPTDGKPSDTADWLMPPYQLAEITGSAEGQILGMMQNVTSAVPFASGADSATVDNKTATGASIVYNAATQRLSAKKFQSQQALREEAQHRIKNCQQFISGSRLAHVFGPDGAQAFREIEIARVQGEFVAELDPVGESEMRQERRAEASAFYQTIMSQAALMAAAGQPINVKELFGWYAKRWGIEDWERFFSQQAASAGAMAAGPGGGGGGEAGPGGGAPSLEPNLGVTSGAAIDASSPSAAGGISQSPAAALARALSMSGGPANAPGM